MTVAVIKDAAARSDFKCALLLLLGALNVFVMADNLNPEEPRTDAN
jgi:hypothetical protein